MTDPDKPKNESAGKTDAAPPYPEDRRQVPRSRVRIPIHYQIIRQGESTITEDGQLLDLSIGGAAFSADREIALETSLRLQIPAGGADGPPEGAKSRSIRGTIVNRSELSGGDWRFGVKFEKLYYALAGWVEELAAAHGGIAGAGASAGRSGDNREDEASGNPAHINNGNNG